MAWSQWLGGRELDLAVRFDVLDACVWDGVSSGIYGTVGSEVGNIFICTTQDI